MKDKKLRSLKFTMTLATVNLLFWFFVAATLGKKIQIENFSLWIAFPVLLAAWVQYRTVLQIRRYKKEERANQTSEPTAPSGRGSS